MRVSKFSFFPPLMPLHFPTQQQYWHIITQSLTIQKISNLLNEVFEYLVGVLKEIFLALGFIESVLRLSLHSLGECGDVSKLRCKQRLFQAFFLSTHTLHMLNLFTFLAMVCNSSLAAVRFLWTSSAWPRAVIEAPTVPLHPFPPHFSAPSWSRQPAPPQGLSGQLLFVLALPWPPHTLRHNRNKDASLI